MRWKKYWESRMKMKRDKIVIGSRESKLAVLQSEMVRDYIKEKNPDLEVEILTMKTTGDIILDRTLDKVGGKGLFVKELDAYGGSGGAAAAGFFQKRRSERRTGSS